MNYIQEKLKQPGKDAVLIRYMGKKDYYDSILDFGLVFSPVSKQSDIHDGKMLYDNSEYAKFNNNIDVNGIRSWTYISCWTLDVLPTLVKFNRYCAERDKNRYAIKTSYRKLIDFCIKNSQFKNGNCMVKRNFFYYGKVDYYYRKELEKSITKPWDEGYPQIAYFLKDSFFYPENEFRLLLYPDSAYNIPCDDNYIIDGVKEYKIDIKNIYGEKHEFIESVYECTTDGKINEILKF